MQVPHTYPDRRICILGCGYVGLTLAATLADVGFEVTGVEIRSDVVKNLRQGRPHFHEPGLADMLGRLVKSGRLSFVEQIPSRAPFDAFIITVGTPIDSGHRVQLQMVEHTTREVAALIAPGALVVMRSTVKLGTTRSVVMPILDATGKPYDIAFCPERTLEGQALGELRHLPQVVGGNTLAATVRASQLFQFLTPTTVRVSGLEAAEMIKLVDNTQRDVHFAFANEIARLCDEAGINAAEVIRAGKLGYPRTNVPLPGPVGGPCLTKDPYILAETFSGAVTPEIILTARRINEAQPNEAVGRIKAATGRIQDFPRAPDIALLGIAFKGRPATDDLRGTMAKPIRDALRAAYPESTIRGWDAVVEARAIEELGILPAASLEAAVTGANIVVIANNHPALSGMPLETIAERFGRPALVYDFWNNCDPTDLQLPRHVRYMALGGGALVDGALAR